MNTIIIRLLVNSNKNDLMQYKVIYLSFLSKRNVLEKQTEIGHGEVSPLQARTNPIHCCNLEGHYHLQHSLLNSLLL